MCSPARCTRAHSITKPVHRKVTATHTRARARTQDRRYRYDDGRSRTATIFVYYKRPMGGGGGDGRPTNERTNAIAKPVEPSVFISTICLQLTRPIVFLAPLLLLLLVSMPVPVPRNDLDTISTFLAVLCAAATAAVAAVAATVAVSCGSDTRHATLMKINKPHVIVGLPVHIIGERDDALERALVGRRRP